MIVNLFFLFAALGLCPTICSYYVRYFNGSFNGVQVIGTGFTLVSIAGMAYAMWF